MTFTKDTFCVYCGSLEHTSADELALVMTNAQEQKISVLLSRDNAILLQNHINDLIKHGDLPVGCLTTADY